MVKVNFKENSSGFSVELLNGTINVPDGFGGYIVSTGCGSGKTRAIKEIIRQKFNDGICYCVDTKDEANKMYNWVLENTELKEDEVSLIHKDNESELFDYYKNPSFIIRKKLVILTHVRFWTDLINYFVVYNQKDSIEAFDGDFFKLMNRDDLRKYIIFDETPQFFRPFATFSNEVLRNYKVTKESGMLSNYFNNNIHNWFNAYFEEGSEDFPQSTELQRIKRDCAISCIPLYYNMWSSMKFSDQKEKKHRLHFYPKDLIQPGMKTKIMVFEGAADILFQHQLEHTKSFQLIDIEDKYNSVVEFNKITHNQIRSNSNYINSNEFQVYLDELANVIKNNNKTLIIVWKDLLDGKKVVMENYSTWFKNTLSQRSDVDSSKFDVTYYGASNTKSTNDFMDYDSIILSGNWNVWNNQSEEEKNKFTDAYLVKTNEYFCMLWYFVQLITRIGIRKHDGKKYSVYYSSTFETEFINDLNRYFNKNLLKVSVDHKVKSSFEEKLKSIKGLHKTSIEKIIRLNNEHDPGIEAAIIDGKEKTVTISLDDMFKYFPVSRKEKNKYKKLIDSIKEKTGLTLIIF